MKRPICTVCNQQFLAINYYRNGVPHYRSRCSVCLRKNRRAKPQVPRWKSAGYKKKPSCDRCGFRAKVSAQLLVYHVDGNLNNVQVRNLKTVCKNCVEEIRLSTLPWKQSPGSDLEPDF